MYAHTVAASRCRASLYLIENLEEIERKGATFAATVGLRTVAGMVKPLKSFEKRGF
jgi:hypothetical protein